MHRASLLAITLTALTAPAAALAQGSAQPPPASARSQAGMPNIRVLDQQSTLDAKPAPLPGGVAHADNWDVPTANPPGQIAKSIDVLSISWGGPTMDLPGATIAQFSINGNAPAGCTPGARYPELRVKAPGERWQLSGVSIVKCEPASMTIRYRSRTALPEGR